MRTGRPRKYVDEEAKRLGINLGQRERRKRWRKAGLCSNCGGPRDREQVRRCEKCEAACRGSRLAQRERLNPVRVVSAQRLPFWPVAHQFIPRWPSPLPGLIATQLVWGLRRKVAA
jgi:hypothetical protein